MVQPAHFLLLNGFGCDSCKCDRVITSGIITTTYILPSPFIDVPGVRNFRVVANLPLENDETKILRSDYLYRSGMLNNIEDTGITKQKLLNIYDVFDLRSPEEMGKFLAEVLPSRVIPGVKRRDGQRIYRSQFLNRGY